MKRNAAVFYIPSSVRQVGRFPALGQGNTNSWPSKFIPAGLTAWPDLLRCLLCYTQLLLHSWEGKPTFDYRACVALPLYELVCHWIKLKNSSFSGRKKCNSHLLLQIVDVWMLYGKLQEPLLIGDTGKTVQGLLPPLLEYPRSNDASTFN